MAKKRLAVTWEKKAETEDFKPTLKHYDRYLHDSGLRESTITSYVFRAGKFLKFAHEELPSEEKFTEFRDILHEKNLTFRIK
jgi:hypothetical protein